MAQTNHYLFDTATGFNDSIGSLNYSAGSGSVGASGKINECLSWSTSAGGAAATGGPSFATPLTPTSVALWIKSSGYGTLTLISNGGTVAEISVSGMASYLNIYIMATSPVTVVLPGMSINTWHHLVIISDGTYYWDFYFNGSYLGSYSSMYSVTSMSMNSIGSGSTSTFNFYIDDLRFYNSSINATEVAFIYNSGSGTQANSGSSGSASGDLDTVLIVEPSGSASGSSGPGAAVGDLGTIIVSSASGIAGVDGSASGSFATVLVYEFSGIAFPEYIAYGSLPSINISAIEAIPVITTAIQLDYIACDGEITWTQTLPITGFSSAIQGQDAISSRTTPTIGASGANIVFFEQRTIAASGSYTYDLTALTDFLGGALSLSRAYAITIAPTSGTARLAPGASNPFQWFFASTTSNISLSQGDAFMFAQPESATITSGSRTLVITNTSGAASLTYKIAILGGR